MKIQALAIIFIILILPISLVVSSYTETRIETLSLQSTYDSKLLDATYDALKAYQLNSYNNDTQYLINSKMRDISASVNTFFNSISTNFSSLGYTQNSIKNYVPALVYTMYDGYYIYSPYDNTWYTDDSKSDRVHIPDQETGKYDGTPQSTNKTLYGLKPYVYYSCRYIRGDIDVVITYSLDNYIHIQGKKGDKSISKSGYILDNNFTINSDRVTVNIGGNSFDITPESELKEYVSFNGNTEFKEYPYIKRNGSKYYLDENGNVFYVLNGQKIIQTPSNITNAYVTAKDIRQNSNAIKYYIEAKELRDFIIENDLDELTTANIVNYETGKIYNPIDTSPYYQIGKIFDFDFTGGIESEQSNFNNHRIDVIKNSIIRNLKVAIANFNNYSNNVTFDFQMPELKDTDWDKIMSNVSIISFMQGVNIGGKIFNGYSIITNNKNDDLVMEDSIYIETRNHTYHRVTDTTLNPADITKGIYNINLERRTGEITYIDADGKSKVKSAYYFPIIGTLSYDSIVTQNNTVSDKISDYLKRPNTNNELKRVYYTALARERYALYRPAEKY